MFKKWFPTLSLLLTLCFSGALAAYPADPYALVNEAASKTFARLQKDQPQIKQDPAYLRQIIREELMP